MLSFENPVLKKKMVYFHSRSQSSDPFGWRYPRVLGIPKIISNGQLTSFYLFCKLETL